MNGTAMKRTIPLASSRDSYHGTVEEFNAELDELAEAQCGSEEERDCEVLDGGWEGWSRHSTPDKEEVPDTPESEDEYAEYYRISHHLWDFFNVTWLNEGPPERWGQEHLKRRALRIRKRIPKKWKPRGLLGKDAEEALDKRFYFRPAIIRADGTRLSAKRQWQNLIRKAGLDPPTDN